jgi:hypothetical protein
MVHIRQFVLTEDSQQSMWEDAEQPNVLKRVSAPGVPGTVPVA